MSHPRLVSTWAPSAVRGLVAFVLVATLAGCDKGEGASQGASLPRRSEAIAARPGAATPAATAVAPKSDEAASSAARTTPLCSAGGAGATPAPVGLRYVTASSVGDGVETSFGGANGWQWVNLWAAWCAPCRAEIPLLRKWEQDFGAAGGRFQLQLISLDDDERQLRDLLAKGTVSGLSGSAWLPEGEGRNSWLRSAGVANAGRLPVHLLIDGSGKVRCRVDGELKESDREDVLALLKSSAGR